MPSGGDPLPLVRLRASGIFAVTSYLGQPLEINTFTEREFSPYFLKPLKAAGIGSGELQTYLLLLLGTLCMIVKVGVSRHHLLLKPQANIL